MNVSSAKRLSMRKMNNSTSGQQPENQRTSLGSAKRRSQPSGCPGSHQFAWDRGGPDLFILSPQNLWQLRYINAGHKIKILCWLCWWLLWRLGLLPKWKPWETRQPGSCQPFSCQLRDSLVTHEFLSHSSPSPGQWNTDKTWGLNNIYITAISTLLWEERTFPPPQMNVTCTPQGKNNWIWLPS